MVLPDAAARKMALLQKAITDVSVLGTSSKPTASPPRKHKPEANPGAMW